MTGRQPRVERIAQDSYRILFDRPLEAEVALMYFGFYPGTSLVWKNGRVVSVVAPASTYEQIVSEWGNSGYRLRDLNNDKSPELINTDPYGQGWLVVIELADADELDELMDAAAYGDLVAES